MNKYLYIALTPVFLPLGYFGYQKAVAAEPVVVSSKDSSASEEWNSAKSVLADKYKTVESLLVQGKSLTFMCSDLRKEDFENSLSVSGGENMYVPIDGNSASSFRWFSSGDRWMQEKFFSYPKTDMIYANNKFDGEKYSSFSSVTQFNLISGQKADVLGLDFIYRGMFESLRSDSIFGSGALRKFSYLSDEAKSQIRYKGKVTLDSDNVELFELSNERLNAQLWFSPEKKMVVKTKNVWTSSKGVAVQVCVLKNFKRFSGIEFPTLIKQEYYEQKNGVKEWRQTLQLEVDDITINDSGVVWDLMSPMKLGSLVRDDVEGENVKVLGQLSAEQINSVKRGIPSSIEEKDAVVNAAAPLVVQRQESLEEQWEARGRGGDTK